MPIDRNEVTANLMRLRDDGHITPWLRDAADETMAAVNDYNYDLAERLTAVKSYIRGTMSSEGYPGERYFGEDREYNERVLGFSAYSFLDGLHHDLAFRAGNLPSGMTAFSGTGDGKIRVRSRGAPRKSSTRASPTLDRIALEHERIERESRERLKRE